MMKRQSKKTYIAFIIFVITMLLIAIPTCAYAVTIEPWSPSSPGSVDGGDPKLPSYDTQYGDKWFHCEYIRNVNGHKEINVSVYDFNGKLIIDPKTDSVLKSNSAGTWAGMLIIEEQSSAYSVSIPVAQEIKKVWTCNYQKVDGPYEDCDWKEVDGTWKCVGNGNYYYITTSTSTKSTTAYYAPSPCKSELGGMKFVSSSWATTTVASGEAKKLCLEKIGEGARNEAKALVEGSISKTQIIDTNEYPKGSDANLQKVLENLPEARSQIYYEKDDESLEHGWYMSGYLKEPFGVCMNAQTAEVRYLTKYTDANKGCREDEIDITENISVNKRLNDGETHTFNVWRYFSPVNTNTGSPFFIQLGGENSKLTVAECWGAIIDYPIRTDYTDVIIPDLNDGRFSGAKFSDIARIKQTHNCYDKYSHAEYDETYCLQEIEQMPKTIEYPDIISRLDNKGEVATPGPKGTRNSITESDILNSPAGRQVKNDGGCIYAEKIDLRVEQKFYGEKDAATVLAGYNFYYRAIDVNNPFPNPLDEYSYWYGHEKDISTNPFKTITYALNSVQSIKSIRNIVNSSTNKYTSWKDITKDGTSKFVTKYQLRVKAPEYYKVGCGPSNADWGYCKS